MHDARMPLLDCTVDSKFPLDMQVCFVYVRLVGDSAFLLGLTSPDIDLLGLRIITLATLVIILISLMKSLTYL